REPQASACVRARPCDRDRHLERAWRGARLARGRAQGVSGRQWRRGARRSGEGGRLIFDGFRDFVDSVGSLPAYHWMLRFLVFYPVWSALVWVSTALYFAWRRERSQAADDSATFTPPVSILVRARKGTGATLAWATEIDYPDYEVVVVDDGASG